MASCWCASFRYLPAAQNSGQLLWLIATITLLEAAIYIAALRTIAASRLRPQAAFDCAVGFSGTVFGLLVVETAVSRSSHRSLMGIYTMPAKWLPWGLLLFWQLLMPGVSFFGHLSGLLVGQMYVWGWLSSVEPSAAWLSWIESLPLLSACRSRDSFILHSGASASPANSLPTTSAAHPRTGLSAALQAWLQSAWPGRGTGAGTGPSGSSSSTSSAGRGWQLLTPPASEGKQFPNQPRRLLEDVEQGSDLGVSAAGTVAAPDSPTAAAREAVREAAEARAAAGQAALARAASAAPSSAASKAGSKA